MRKGIVSLVHRTPELSILSASIGKLNDNRHPKGSGYHEPVFFQETGWNVAGGEEDVERAKRENSDVEQVGSGVPFPELCQLGRFKKVVQANTGVAHREKLSVHCSSI